jgi:hypothetical protein
MNSYSHFVPMINMYLSNFVCVFIYILSVTYYTSRKGKNGDVPYVRKTTATDVVPCVLLSRSSYLTLSVSATVYSCFPSSSTFLSSNFNTCSCPRPPVCLPSIPHHHRQPEPPASHLLRPAPLPRRLGAPPCSSRHLRRSTAAPDLPS